MPWFKIDDGFHCHPKVFAAGTAAVGLYVRCGSWVAQQATDGVIPKDVARLYGTPRMIKALVAAGLWHQKGHDCESCPELDATSYVIHQYLAYNPSRTAIESERAAKTERQRRWRERRRGAPVDASTGADSESTQREVDANLNGIRNENGRDSEPSWGADSEQNSSDSHTNQQINAGSALDVDASTRTPHRHHGDAAPNPTRPNPVVPSEKEQPEETASYAREPDARIGDRPRIPEASRPLVDALTASGMAVGWDLQPNEWFLVEALIKRCGVAALVVSAKGSWQGARTQPRSGRYFLPAWRTLSDAPIEVPDQSGSSLPAAVGQVVPLTGTDARVAGWAALTQRLRDRDAQENP